jgi:hypothetical protein
LADCRAFCLQCFKLSSLDQVIQRVKDMLLVIIGELLQFQDAVHGSFIHLFIRSTYQKIQRHVQVACHLGGHLNRWFHFIAFISADHRAFGIEELGNLFLGDPPLARVCDACEKGRQKLK